MPLAVPDKQAGNKLPVLELARNNRLFAHEGEAKRKDMKGEEGRECRRGAGRGNRRGKERAADEKKTKGRGKGQEGTTDILFELKAAWAKISYYY